MVDYNLVKGGIIWPPKIDSRNLKLENYVLSSGLLYPEEIDWTSAVPSYGMFQNDNFSCCTLSGVANLILQMSYNSGKQYQISDDDVLKAYSDITGFDPARPETDNGAHLIDVLNYWRQVGIGGNKIAAFVELDINNLAQIFGALYAFGGIYAGADLPKIIEEEPLFWDIDDPNFQGDSKPGTWGPHCVVLGAASLQFLGSITWGEIQRLTLPFFSNYFFQAFAVLDDLWLSTSGITLSGLDLNGLNEDLKMVTR
jgi:hypothetical protein